MADLDQYCTLRRQTLVNLISGGSALVSVIVGSSLMKFFTDIAGLGP